MLLPAGHPRNAVAFAIGASACLAMLVGVERYQPNARGAWHTVITGATSWVVGDAIKAWHPAGLGGVADTIGESLNLATYVLVVIGLLRLAKARTSFPDATPALDTAIITVAAAMTTWVLLLEPVTGAGASPETLRALAFPLGNVLLMGALLRLGHVPGLVGTATRLVGLVTLTVLALDLAGSIRSGAALHTDPTVLDPRWQIGFAVAGTACLHPSMRRLSERVAAPRRRAHALQVVALLAAMLTGPALGAWQVAEGREPTTGPIAAFTSAIMVLVALRMLSMVRQINRQATTDDLTGLPNRRALAAAARVRLTDPRERQALLLLDLDRFKEVNDALGHAAGDELLVQVTTRLRSRLRAGDLLVRLGGDEFAVLLDCPGVAEAEIVARSLVTVLADRFPLEDLSVQTNASIGVALFPDHGKDLSLLMRRADAAMYRSKQDGRVHVHDDPDMDDRSGQLRLAEEFRAALGTGQLVLHYQPKVDLATGRAVGVEALVRWQHPTRGLLYPDAFLELVETTGLMRPMTEEVLSTALDQVATWRVAGRATSVAVNLSPSVLVDVSLPDHIAVRLAERRLPASALELEITEESLMSDRARARTILSALRDHGVKISVDDFGTGYSSLAYLRDLPIDELKLDKSFVLPMSDDPRAVALVTSTIGLAHSLGLRMVAEGVENGHVYRTLSRLGCDEAQGYYLAKPLPADELEHWFAEREQRAIAAVAVGR